MTIEKEKRRILITGGAGFIGWRAAALLADNGHKIAIVDNLHVGMPMPTDERYDTYKVDIRDEANLSEAFGDFCPDLVIHLAAIHHIPTCEQQRSFAQDVNIVGTETLLKICERYDVCRFVLASSGAVYDWLDGPLNEETTALRAYDNYALCKLANEMQVRFWSERGFGREARVARIFNTIGHDDPNAHLIPDILNQLHQTEGIVTIHLGNVAPKRDYIHADDTAAGIVALALSAIEDSFSEMNIGTGQEASVEQLVQTIGEAMNVSIQIKSDPLRVRRVDRLRQLADVDKITNATGWRAKENLASAIRQIVERFEFVKKPSQDNT